MRPQLRELADRIGRGPLAGHGFTRRRGRFIKSDELLRSVWLDQLFNTSRALVFDVLFDVGIPGISAFSSTSQEWIVRAYGRRVRRRLGNRRVKLEFPPDHISEPVYDVALETIDIACREFLLRYESAQQFYLMVRDSAVAALGDPEGRNEFDRLDLEPWNVFPRLELAAVYAAYLGHEEESAMLAREAILYAKRRGIDYGIPRIQEAVQHAAGLAQAK